MQQCNWFGDDLPPGLCRHADFHDGGGARSAVCVSTNLDLYVQSRRVEAARPWSRRTALTLHGACGDERGLVGGISASFFSWRCWLVKLNTTIFSTGRKIDSELTSDPKTPAPGDVPSCLTLQQNPQVPPYPSPSRPLPFPLPRDTRCAPFSTRNKEEKEKESKDWSKNYIRHCYYLQHKPETREKKLTPPSSAQARRLVETLDTTPGRSKNNNSKIPGATMGEEDPNEDRQDPKWKAVAKKRTFT